MKIMKKMAALVIAMVMVAAAAIPAMAAQSSVNTITVNGAKEGETYKAFKMLELYVDDTSNPQAYTYTVATDWADFFADENIAVWGTVLEKDATGTYFTAKGDVTSEQAWSATSDLSAFAEAAAQYAANNNLTQVNKQTCAEGATSVVLNTAESGYYLVTSTLGTRAMIDTTPGNVEINEKNEEDTIEKTVKEDSTDVYGENNDAQVGDTVEFKSVVNIVPRSINVKVHDTMDSGLTLNPDSIKIYTNENLSTEYTAAMVRTGIGTSAAPDTGDTFTIDIPDTFAATATAAQDLYIVYTAEVNKNAVVKDSNGVAVVDQNNKTTVQFGDGTKSTEDSTTTTTHKFSVFKHNNSNDHLANAIFEVKKNGTVVNMIKLDDNNYRIVDDTETGEAATHVAPNNEVATVAVNSVVSDFVTVATGDIVIWGVDSDDNYSITELQAPKGYNMLNPAEVPVTVDANNNTRVSVKNNSGTELPSTGGIGTTILYIIGAILVLCAGILLVVRRRMNAK